MPYFLRCAQQAYSHYELGDRDIPTGVLIAYAAFRHTSVDYLLRLTDERTLYPRKQ